MVPTHVPYVLVMLADFPPWTGMPARGALPAREFWYRFWFLDTFHDLNELWTRDPPVEFVVQGIFNPPANVNGYPETDDFDFEIVPFEQDFLVADIPPMADYVEALVDQTLDELGFPVAI
ncbi:hypothetical protein AB9F36_07475 [Rhizobium leguminosarum]|uniref:hypothetical protein n=1 Tax=Rhizobium leguminosarum TaxID=384 RepID=UPI003F9CF5C7